jgi:E3 ubiquitin-protein ligase MYCBP2
MKTSFCQLQLYSSTSGLPLEVPRIEILGNSSPFAAYASIRQLVLEVSFAEESKKWLVTSEDRDNENDNASERIPSPLSLPKVVGLGLETVFQLVKESHVKHSSLCVKALEALLNILGGQYPQSLRKEPIPVIGIKFYNLKKLKNLFVI